MKRIFFISFIFSLCFMSACSFHVTKNVADELQPAILYEAFQTEPVKLSQYSRCSSPTQINLVNAEKRIDDYYMGDLQGSDIYMNPREMTKYTIEYMQDAFLRSGIKTNFSTGKRINVSIDEAKILWVFLGRGASMSLKINIPEIKYTKIYSVESWTGGTNFYRPIAYTIHENTWKMISDPNVKNYLLCRDDVTNEKQVPGETALNILKKRYARGEITKEQYEQMKKDIQ